MPRPAAVRFDPTAFLSRIENGKATRTYRSRQTVFAQGDKADAVYFLESGQVKLTVVSAGGKSAVIALLGPGTFFGEGCLAGQPLRMSTANAVQATKVT